MLVGFGRSLIRRPVVEIGSIPQFRHWLAVSPMSAPPIEMTLFGNEYGSMLVHHLLSESCFIRSALKSPACDHGIVLCGPARMFEEQMAPASVVN